MHTFVQFRVFCPVWMSSAESHMVWLDIIAHSAKRMCEGELCCLGHRRKVSLCPVFAL